MREERSIKLAINVVVNIYDQRKWSLGESQYQALTSSFVSF